MKKEKELLELFRKMDRETKGFFVEDFERYVKDEELFTVNEYIDVTIKEWLPCWIEEAEKRQEEELKNLYEWLLERLVELSNKKEVMGIGDILKNSNGVSYVMIDKKNDYSLLLSTSKAVNEYVVCKYLEVEDGEITWCYGSYLSNLSTAMEYFKEKTE